MNKCSILLLFLPLSFSYANSTSLDDLAAKCAPQVHPLTLKALVHTESGFNPFAIAVVRGAKQPTQPKSYGEAIRVIQYLNSVGANFSVGLAQINSANFNRYRVNAEMLLDPCLNLNISQKILQDCHSRSADINKTLSCYYSGNFTRGFVLDYNNSSYVGRVYAKNKLKQSEVYIPNLDSTPPPVLVKTKAKKAVNTNKSTQRVSHKKYSMLDFEKSGE